MPPRQVDVVLTRSDEAGGGLVRLSSSEVPIQKKQRRFQGRVALQPDIDLSRFRSSAVIDWIEVEITTLRPTQVRYLQEAIEKSGFRTPFVEALDGNRLTHTAMKWRIRLQEAEPRKLLSALDELNKKFSTADTPMRSKVAGLEISIDFFQEDPSAEDRAKLVGVLRRAIFPKPARSLSEGETPRTVGGSRSPSFLFTKIGEEPSDEDAFDGRRHFGGPVDHTFYVGRRKGPWMVRVQEKWSDQRNGTTYAKLDELKRRARVEVTLERMELQRMGIVTVGDLAGFPLASLQGEFFQFFHPTFTGALGEAAPMKQVVAKGLEDLEVERFRHSGVLGLRWHRAEVLKRRAVGFKKRNLDRKLAKCGPLRMPAARDSMNGTDLAFDELNAMVQSALKNLGDRIRRALMP